MSTRLQAWGWAKNNIKEKLNVGILKLDTTVNECTKSNSFGCADIL